MAQRKTRGQTTALGKYLINLFVSCDRIKVSSFPWGYLEVLKTLLQITIDSMLGCSSFRFLLEENKNSALHCSFGRYISYYCYAQ